MTLFAVLLCVMLFAIGVGYAIYMANPISQEYFLKLTSLI